MPSGLNYYSKKPKFIRSGDWDGVGYYYHRGNGVWQKWSRVRDLKRGSKTRIGMGRYKHFDDKKG